MIVFYSSIKVVETFKIPDLLKHSFDCVTGMRDVPDSFKNITWDCSTESGEWKHERNIMSFEIDAEKKVVAFRISTVDKNDELWTIDLVLKEYENNLQVRLAREKREISVVYDNKFNIPYIFKKLIRDGVGGIDNNIPINDKPLFINTSNISIIEKIINGKAKYDLPIIYVSHLFENDDYYLDVSELAKDMAGSAHVIVEESSDISYILRNITDEKNAYNGAIDVFYSNNNSFRYLKNAESNANQFRYRVSHAVYSRMALRNIDDEYSLSSIKLRNRIKKLNVNNIETQKLELEIETLKEKLAEANEFNDFILEEYDLLEKKNNQLENDNMSLSNKVEALNEALKKKNKNSDMIIKLQYSEEQFYDDEIKRIILETIKNTISVFGDEERKRRDYHILKDIINSNTYSEVGETIKKQIFQILKKNSLSKIDSNELKSIGFEQKTGSHDKYIFHNDDRYIVTVSNTPSDFRGGENMAHEAVNLIFGRT